MQDRPHPLPRPRPFGEALEHLLAMYLKEYPLIHLLEEMRSIVRSLEGRRPLTK